MSLCNHWQHAVKVGTFTVWASGIAGVKFATMDDSKIPDLGVYLDKAWSTAFILDTVSVGTEIAGYSERHALFLQWPDFKTISLERFQWVVETVAERVLDGQTVEIGCLGAHGRTGTLLAAVIAVVEKLSAREAILAVRARHCEHAVETDAQQTMIFDLLGEPVKLLPTAKKTFSKPIVTGGSSVSGKTGTTVWSSPDKLSMSQTEIDSWWADQEADPLFGDLVKIDDPDDEGDLPNTCTWCWGVVGISCDCPGAMIDLVGRDLPLVINAERVGGKKKKKQKKNK